jgi:predicted AlkP superfamily phosphohydrolase/phosphomutase
MGLGQIFVNLKGRETDGIVAPEEVPALLAEIEKKALALKNPYLPEERPVSRVFRLHEVYRGPRAKEAAEIQLAFANGYRVSWQTALLGGLDRPVVEENLAPWSGDHCSTDPDQVPGVLLSSRRIPDAPAGRMYHLRDIAATALEWFGLPWSDLDGEPVPVPMPHRSAGGP